MNKISKCGEYILNNLQLNGLTQRDASILTDVHKSNLSEIIRGTRPMTIAIACKMESWLPQFRAIDCLTIQLIQDIKNHKSCD